MYWTYLRRELVGRKKQTIIVAAGPRDRDRPRDRRQLPRRRECATRRPQALESVYGVGTDLTVTGARPSPAAGGGPQFEFDEDGGEQTDDGTTSLSQSRLMTDSDAGHARRLDRRHGHRRRRRGGGIRRPEPDQHDLLGRAARAPTAPDADGRMPDRGHGGCRPGRRSAASAAGSSTSNAFTVLGIDPAATATSGRSSAVTLERRPRPRPPTTPARTSPCSTPPTPRATTSPSATRSTSGGTEMEVVGIVTSTSSEADTAANVYIPLDVAQSIAGVERRRVDRLRAGRLRRRDRRGAGRHRRRRCRTRPSVRSPTSRRPCRARSPAPSRLITNLGTWLSIIVLAVAVGLAVLFTISGVSRRTREFGTLKAIGWSNGRVVGQVAGESVVQGLLGGAVGLALGLVGIWVINIVSPTISTAPSAVTVGRSRRRRAGLAAGAPASAVSCRRAARRTSS